MWIVAKPGAGGVQQAAKDAASAEAVPEGEFATVAADMNTTCDAISDLQWRCLVGSNGTRFRIDIMEHGDDYVVTEVVAVGTYQPSN